MVRQMKKLLHRKMQCLYEECAIFVVLFLSMFFFLSVSHAEDTVRSAEARKTLGEIRQSISLSRERVAFLSRQVERLKKDQRALSDALIKAAKEERAVANDISEREEKLKEMLKKRKQVHQSLKSRRTEFAEVLSILERMGLKPPPALVVRPEDVLASVRSSVLLGAVVPQMQEKTQALTESLKELTNLSNAITVEYAALKTKMQNQAEQRKHLELLLDKKAKLQKRSEEELTEQQQKNSALVKKAQSLEELILELDRQSQLNSDVSVQMQKTLQLLEQSNFENQKGSLLFPVLGKSIQHVKNSSQITRFGEMIETEAEAIIVAPADALVAFAGPFRSYGQLIILNVGNGYHIVLTGMSKINVTQGQFVLSGEPLGTMGMQFIANSVALDIGKTAPMLYIEFRKHGKPVNPTPWWRTEKTKRNRNDS
ncbi:peptidase M23 [Bartonella henselae]|uniref:Filament-A percursor n=1 Tax=Bartonella henselae TaxID=38323 RepID=X5M327_BARHN|nr:peptidoglycan DD-metalloendopeptidase family protein [Bartonella henselae]MDM9996257.1 peptidoglycan DD-metalloendopeptidase family protein [Bartonella henselae]OLL51757.1 peptidase M23 [Bartonella henselae]OLL57642.1 peptidase M23 [Bartonella henselae]UJM42824.1 peptidoglycan DD-metalloendopeptidase family protein [Bartonella henselae]CDO46196.1 filament-A percursor [Bartonella henselae]